MIRPNAPKSQMIDGDAFERLAQKHHLFYATTHLLRDERQVDEIAALPAPVNVLSHNSDGGILPAMVNVLSRDSDDDMPAQETPLSWFDFIWDDAPDNIGHWFAQNCDVQDDRLTPIPIGLECDRWHPPSMKKDIILATPELERTGLAYLNYTIRASHRTQRAAAYDMFSCAPWVTTEHSKSFEHYTRQLASHKFVFSPDGNGMDCVRTWEALYLGCYPIVERHVFTEEFAKELPILVVDDWSYITEDFLSVEYERMTAREWNWDALTVEWWDGLIGSRI